MSDKTISLIILSIVVFIVIVYTLVIWECHKNEVFIFAPYDFTPNYPAFQPLGEIISLSPDEQAARNAAIDKSLKDGTQS